MIVRPANLRNLAPDHVLVLVKLVAAAAGAMGRGVGHRGLHQPRNGATNTGRNSIAGDKLHYWVIPPEQDAEFVAAMEEVLETYAQPDAAQQPVLCMDEQMSALPFFRACHANRSVTAHDMLEA